MRMATLGSGAGYGSVSSLALLSDGRIAAGYFEPHVIRVWDVKRRALDVIINGHVENARAIAALPDGRLLSGSWDCTLKVWDERVLTARYAASRNTCAATLAGHARGVNALAVLPDRRVVSGDVGGIVRVWQ